MDINWDQPFLLNLPLNAWVLGLIGLMAPYVLRAIRSMTANAYIAASKNWLRTALMIQMLCGGLLAFWYATDDPITGSEALRMILGVAIYLHGFISITRLNKLDADNRKNENKPNASPRSGKDLPEDRPPNNAP